MANAWIIEPAAISSASGSGTVSGTDATNVGNDYAGVVWRGGPGSPAIIIDLGDDVPIDTVALFGLKSSDAASGFSIFLATEAQGPGFAAGAYWEAGLAVAGSAGMTSGKEVAIWSAPDPGGPPNAVRYIRIWFFDVPSGGEVEIARIVAGKCIALSRNFSFGAGLGVRDLGSLDFSRRGVLRRSRGAKLRTCQLTFSNVSKDEVEAVTKPLLERIGNTEMVAVVTDPSADPQRQNRCYYGPLVGDLGHTWRKANLFEAKINVVSIF